MSSSFCFFGLKSPLPPTHAWWDVVWEVGFASFTKRTDEHLQMMRTIQSESNFGAVFCCTFLSVPITLLRSIESKITSPLKEQKGDKSSSSGKSMRQFNFMARKMRLKIPNCKPGPPNPMSLRMCKHKVFGGLAMESFFIASTLMGFWGGTICLFLDLQHSQLTSFTISLWKKNSKHFSKVHETL